jgi:chromosome partitioning protein
MIISILNQKGGVGKTTLAVNLARAFTRQGKKTLLVDTDDQGSATQWHVRANADLVDVACLATVTIEKDIQKYLSMYDYIFIDGIPRISPLTVMSVRMSNIVLIPVQPSPYDIWASEDIVRHAKDRQVITEGKLKVFFVVSRKITNTNLSKEVTNELDKLELPTFVNSTSQRVAYATSVEKGLTVLDGEFYGTEACKEIEKIAQELWEKIDGSD